MANSISFSSTSVVGLMLVSCAVTMYMPTENDAIKYNTSLLSLNQDRDLYINTCGRCHPLLKPFAYSTERWTRNLNRMQKRAKINDAQKN